MTRKRLLPGGFDPWLAFILVSAAVLLLYRLDHRPLWQDEAETACLARSVLDHGLPIAHDGKNLVSQEEGREFGGDHLWRWSPWAQIYIAAGGIRLGGATTTPVRLPFAAMGLICVWLVYRLVRRHFGDVAWARMAAAMLAFSVPFLLYSRQCRYYSLGALLVLCILYLFLADWPSRFAPAALLACAATLLFHTNYVLFFSFAVALGLPAILLYHRRLPARRTVVLVLVCVAAVVPGLFLYRTIGQTGMIDVSLFHKRVERYGADLAQFFVPLPVAAVVLLGWLCRCLAKRTVPDEGAERFVMLISFCILLHPLVLGVVPQQAVRYLVHLLPVACIILAWVVRRTWDFHRPSAVLLFALLAFTNWLHIVPMDWLRIAQRPWHNDVDMLTSPNIPLRLFIAELRDGYPDVNDGIIRFLQARAAPGESVLTTYGDLPLQYYTECRVLGGLQDRVPAVGEKPDWVVPRNCSRLDRKGEFIASVAFIREQLDLDADYDVTVLAGRDELYGNRPDPYNHRFRPVTEPFTHLRIYHRKGSLHD